MKRVLILGGTAEARALASALTASGIPVVSSMAGRVSRPRIPAGEVRMGGFGGPEGLAVYLREARITHVIDATHPFATTMTANGAEAARRTGTPLVRFARPGWRDHPDADQWRWVDSYTEARSAADELGKRPFVTTGRQTLHHYIGPWRERDVLVRVVEPLDDSAPAAWQVVLDRGPYEPGAELELMSKHRIDVLLTKDSGGAYTAAKLDAAARLGIPVVVVRRPRVPVEVLEVTSVEDVVAALG